MNIHSGATTPRVKLNERDRSRGDREGLPPQTTVSAASPDEKVEMAFGLPGMTLQHEDQQCRLHTGHDTERGAGAGT